MFTAVVFTPHNRPEFRQINENDLSKILDGGYLEGITIDQQTVAFVDEEGRMKNLIPNQFADACIRALLNRNGRILNGDTIVGNCILCGVSPDGDCANVNEEITAFINTLFPADSQESN